LSGARNFLGNPVKPAADKDGSIMIPLIKSRAGGTESQVFQVEIVYLTQLDGGAMRGRGRLALNVCPKVDIPINQLYVTLCLPANFRYGEFDGDIKEVRYFTSQPPYRASPINNFAPLRQQAAFNTQFEGDQDQCFEVPTASHHAAPGAAMMASLVPVRVDVPMVGEPHYFTSMLVMGDVLNLSVEYKERVKGYFAKRRV
jgi:hypothetical protein